MPSSVPAFEAKPKLTENRSAPAEQRVVCYSIQAEAEPGVMPRVLEVFAKRNLVPSRWVSDVSGPGARELSIDVQVAGLSYAESDYVARCLRSLHYVETVLTAEKRIL